MTFHARCLQDASLIILANESSRLPVSTQLVGVIVEDIGFSSEVLPIVGIITLGLVVFLVLGTPLCLKVVHIEVCVFLEEPNNSGLNVFHRVCERAIVSILTVVYVSWELGTEFSFILFHMIQSFNSVMSQFTSILLRTFVCFRVVTELRRVVAVLSSFVFD